MKRDDRHALVSAPQEPAEASVFALFAAQAAAFPDRVAVLAQTGDRSYAELAARAEAVCRFLLARGLVPEQPVGVLMEGSADLLAVLLGIWQAGGAYLPFDAQDPPARVSRMLGLGGCRLVLGDAPLLAAVQAAQAAQATAGPGLDCCDTASIPALPPGWTPTACKSGGSHLAYLLFTSGSTGDPKAVAIEHRSIVDLLLAVRELLNFSAADRYLASSTVGFDISVAEMFLPLITGASLLMRDRMLMLEPHRLASDIRTHGVSVVQTGPSIWSMILGEVPDFPRLRVAISTGEAIAPELARRLAACGDEVWNLYGPTETTVWCTAQRLSTDPAAHPLASTMSAPIGRPLHHLQALVIDEQGQPVPDGVQGELCIAGSGVARGYLGNEALTQQRFIGLGGLRCYRTGDVALRDADGVLHYYGRNDDQLKIRGVRVEPSEVESAILLDARVAQAAATWFDTPAGTRAIVAAVVLRPGLSCTARELHQALRAHLTLAMIPARFLFVPWLPMTTSGKVDRKAIRHAVASAPAEDLPAVPQRALSATEQGLAGIWQRLLDLPSVGPDDEFFSIGGDSLAMVQMMVDAEALFGVGLPPQLVFEAPALAALARRIDRLRERLDDDLGRGHVFPVADAAAGTPIFFSNLDIVLARRGVWTVPCPLYSIANWAKGSGFVKAASIPALAAAHVQAVRRVQPRGPYRLAGYSLGGPIALEMAQQLVACGEQVDMLFLLDPMDPLCGDGVPAVWQADPWAERASRLARRIAQGPGKLGLREWLSTLLPLRGSALLQWVQYQLVHLYGRYPNRWTRRLLPRDRWHAFWFAARRMMRSYVASPYNGRTLLVLVGDGAAAKVWGPLLGPAAETRVLESTTHDRLFEDPALGRWMGWLTQALAAKA